MTRKTKRQPKLDQPTVDRILAHYAKLKLDLGWTRERFHRLCKMLSCTPRELTALCGVIGNRKYYRKPKTVLMWNKMNCWLKQDKIPPYVALNLAMIENAYLEATCGLAHEPTMPATLLVTTEAEHVPVHD